MAFQSGGEFPVFRGSRHQQGYGLGNILRSVVKSVHPIFKPAQSYIKKRALQGGVNIVKNVLGGKGLKEALKQEAQSGLKDVSSKAIEFLSNTGKTIQQRKRKSRLVSKTKSKKQRGRGVDLFD